jgi:predicted nucleotidyltransferase
MRMLYHPVGLVLVILGSCALSVKSPAEGFTRLDPKNTGLRHRNPIDIDHPLHRLHATSLACGGIAIGDLDGDTWPDLFVSSGPGPNHLYMQRGEWTFSDQTAISGLAGQDNWTLGVSFTDIDGDGDLDIYLCNYDQPNQCFLNDGAGGFSDEAPRLGIDIRDASLMSAFCDYDRDGDLDLYLLTYRYFLDHRGPDAAKTRRGQAFKDWERYFLRKGRSYYPVGRPDRLMQNTGKGVFKDVTESAGLNHGPAHGNSAVWWDYDEDGWMDLYVANDYQDADRLYRNRGDGTFEEKLREATPQTGWFSTGSASGDLNNDGRVDLLVVGIAPVTHFSTMLNTGNLQSLDRFLDQVEPRQFARNAVFLNTRTSHLLEGANLAGLGQSDWSWGVKIQDFDNDGRMDVFIANGVSRPYRDSDLARLHKAALRTNNVWDVYASYPPQKEANRLFRNRGDLQFEDMAPQWGMNTPSMSYATACGDFDKDGDLDLVVASLDEPIALYRNDTKALGLTLRLRGLENNRRGIGATVRLKSARHTLTRQLMPDQGFMSCDQDILHFGLGEDEVVEELRITWPNQYEEVYTNIIARRSYDLEEGALEKRKPEAIKPLFTASPLLKRMSPSHATEIRHKENLYNDYQNQALLPYKLSRLGPGLALSDVNGDQRDDLFLAGAIGMSSELQLQQEDGGFSWSFQKAFNAHRNGEALGALFFEADGDGDPDLYVAYGGYENPEGSPLLRDQLYLNDGTGKFPAAPANNLPDIRTSSSVVSAADADRDGDLDLFIGGRVIPRNYPGHPPSRLLLNDGHGRFSDVTDRRAPALLSSGLVTGACWSDVDNDGWLDLMVCHEWGPVKFYHNRMQSGEGLVDATAATGLSAWTGWWNGITPTDTDGDGDIDFVVTNVGLGSPYRASPKQPTVLFYGAFNPGEGHQLVEATFKEGRLVPLRGRAALSKVMPGIAERFPSFRSFAEASLLDLYPREQLRRAERFTANTLASGILVNDAGRFRFVPLPRMAQIAPLFGAVASDFDGDGFPDLALVGNFYHAQRETPRRAGGMGWLLKGKGDGNFDVQWPDRSGISVPGDARSLVITDLNRDGAPDLVVGLNDQALQAFINTAAPGIRLALEGKPGNPRCIGARVTMVFGEAGKQTQEVYAGTGYLSQSPGVCWFGRPGGADLTRIQVRWPDGVLQAYKPSNAQARQYRIKR